MVSLAEHPTPQTAVPAKAEIDVSAVLLDCQLFSDLIPAELEQLRPSFKLIPMNAGDWVFREGAEGDHLYIVASGRVEIFKESAHRNSIRVAIKTQGRAFGEMALIDGEPRSASAQCAESGWLLLLTQNAFDTMCTKLPTLGAKILRRLSQMLSQRLRQATGIMVDHLDTAA